MMEPGDLISGAGHAFITKDFDHIIQQCDIPLMFGIDGQDFLVRSQDQLERVLEGFHDDLTQQGIKSGDTHLRSFVLNDDIMIIAASTKFGDAHGALVNTSSTKYIFRKRQEMWKVFSVLVDKKVNTQENAALMEH